MSVLLPLTPASLTPNSGISFFALIWTVKPDSLAGLYVLAILMGISSFIMLPVALELAAEVVWNVVGPATVGSILYLLGNGESLAIELGAELRQDHSVQRRHRRVDECSSSRRRRRAAAQYADRKSVV